MSTLRNRTLLCLLLSFTLLASFSAIAAAQRTLVFWHSGIELDAVDWLRQEIFPRFEDEHHVIIEDAAIGWGAGREEKLLVAYAAGLSPDVFVGNGTTQNVIPLDHYFERWAERDVIVPGFLDPMRDPNGVLRAIPHLAEVRGFAYSKYIAEEVGLEAEVPPNSWDELQEWARRMTRIDGDTVTRSGFETIWRAPFVGSEYDWFLLQAGGTVSSLDMRTATIRSDAGLQALRVLRDLYQIGHPPHASSQITEGDFADGRVGIARGGSWVLGPWEEVHNGDVSGLGIFAPRMDSDHDPVAITFVNGYVISDQSTDPDLAWLLIETLMSSEVQLAFAKYNDRLSVRQDVGTMVTDESVRRYLPWYRIAEHGATPGFFPGRGAAAGYIRQVLFSEMAPETALIMMQDAQQNAIDAFWEE